MAGYLPVTVRSLTRRRCEAVAVGLRFGRLRTLDGTPSPQNGDAHSYGSFTSPPTTRRDPLGQCDLLSCVSEASRNIEKSLTSEQVQFFFRAYSSVG